MSQRELPRAAIAMIALAALLAFNPAAAKQPYAGQQARPIATLSPADIAAIESGQGWGLAKPAELNGYPGPLHVLELAQQLTLTADQEKRIKSVYEAMRQRAIEAGKRYLASERHVDLLFRTGNATRERLREALRIAATARADLRAVHLAAHIETTPILNDRQRRTYAKLRGYDNAGPPAHQGSHAGSHSGHNKH